MSKSAKKAADQAEREKVHKRYSNRREPDVIYPAKKQVDFYDADIHQRVAVYVRVSTDNLGQETSYELQKNYYEEFVLKHPNWKLVKIYADKGISGTSTKHRVELNQMLADSRAGKIDLIITKSVSRLARNTVDCITMVRNLAELRNPVGVFFESECIFSLNEDTNMPLSFLASIAENESRIRSRSMEVSLAQRLNGGLPLTPKLLGYSHDTDGKLVINPDEAPTVKLIFYMYLSGYSSSHIAKTLEALGKRTFLGNSKWTSGTVIQVLRNERHCGDVLTRKTFTPDVISHKSKKNRGERQQSLYKGEHEAIVSRDDYIAVQHMINNAKYGGKSILPELRVIESGVLKGFGKLLQNEGDSVFIFDLSEPEIFIQSYLMTGTDSPISGDGELSPLSVSGKRIRAVPKKLADRFGSDFYSHRLTSSSPELQSEDAWKLWLEGQLFETGEKLRVTKFDEMQRFIAEQLAPIKQMEEVDFNA